MFVYSLRKSSENNDEKYFENAKTALNIFVTILDANKKI